MFDRSYYAGLICFLLIYCRWHYYYLWLQFGVSDSVMIGSVVVSVTTNSDTFIIMPILFAGDTITISGNNFGVSGSVMIGSVVAFVTTNSNTFISLPI